MMMRRYATAAAACVFLLGCSGGGPSYKLVPVTGTVTLNNKPLEGASISFLPDPTNRDGQPANDVTGPDGNFKMMTRGRSGLVAGKYKVLISKSLVDIARAPEDFKEDPFMAKLAVEGPDAERATKKGAAKIESEHEAEVPPEGGVLDFDVKAKSATAAKLSGSATPAK